MSDEQRLPSVERQPLQPQPPMADWQPIRRATPRPQHSVDLQVGELVLHGFAPVDRYRIGEAVERELTRLFVEQGVPPALVTGGEVARIVGGTFDLSAGASADTVGSQVAQAIYHGLER